jgi:hypothetical protein
MGMRAETFWGKTLRQYYTVPEKGSTSIPEIASAIGHKPNQRRLLW